MSRSSGIHWCLLDSEVSPTLLSFTFHEMFLQMQAMGTPCHMIKLWKNGNEMISEAELVDALKKHPADIIAWIGVDGWKYFDVLSRCTSSKVNFWFDDPIVRLTHKVDIINKMRSVSNHPKWKVFCWDTYWGSELGAALGVRHAPFFLQLAANPKYYFPSTRQLSDDIVFLGTLQSPMAMWMQLNDMPEIFQVVARRCVELIKAHKGILPAWDVIFRDAKASLQSHDLNIFLQSCLMMDGNLNSLHNFLWQYLKNEARIRCLKQCLKVGKVRMITETAQRGHATPFEVFGMLDEWDMSKLMVCRSDRVPLESIGHLYHYGKIQVQAVDPQSVKEGVPYRMFQAGMSGRPLLTDWRPGWSNHFKKEDYWVYDDYEAIPDLLTDALKDKDKLEEKGMLNCINANDHHTWEQRIKQVELIAVDPLAGINFYSDE